MRDEGRAFLLHLLDAPVEMTLLHLELGDAVAEQTADAIGAFVHGDVVAGARELLRRRESRRSTADDGDALAGLAIGQDRRDVTVVPRVVDDLDLDLLDRDGRFAD